MDSCYAVVDKTRTFVKKDCETGQLEIYESMLEAEVNCPDDCLLAEVSVRKQGASCYDKNKEISDQLKELISEHYKETGVMVESLRTEHAAFVGGDKSITSISVSVTK